jgi:hypothetical protein
MIHVSHVLNTRSDFMCYMQSKLGELELVESVLKPELVASLHKLHPDAFPTDPDEYDLNEPITQIGAYSLTCTTNRTKYKIWAVQDPFCKQTTGA